MDTTTATFPAAHMGRFIAKVDAVNARLERAHVADRFTYTAERFAEETSTPGMFTEMVSIEMSQPVISIGSWDFMAAIVVEEGGTVVHCAPGFTFPASIVRPTTHQCDHCNINRERNKSYLIVNRLNGEIMQLGSSCVELFLGVSVKGLWTLEYTMAEISDMFEADYAIAREGYQFNVNTVLAISMALTNGGKGFVSRAKGREGLEATADRAMFVFFPGNRTEDVKEAIAISLAADQVPAADIEAVKAAVRDMRDSDYKDNLLAAINSELISARSFGTLVSAVGVYARSIAQEAERKANPRVQGFLGEAKDKLVLDATVVAMREIDGAFGTTTLITFRTESGHTAKWFASNAPQVEVGAHVTVKGTVKGHETYEGQDSTLITRCKVEVLAAA